MKDASENISWYDYNDVVALFEHDVLAQYEEEDYQGDSWYVLLNGSRYGWLTFGWGSCSGCDALQACSNAQEVNELRDELYRSITWYDSKKELLEWLESKEWSTEYSSPSTDFIQEVGKIMSE